MDMPSGENIQNLADKITNVELLLKSAKPEGFFDYYNIRSPLLGNEISLGNIAKEDMLSILLNTWYIEDLLCEGQIDLALDEMTLAQNLWKSTMSIDAAFLENITRNKIEYSTSQTLHEYSHSPKKKTLFGGGKKQDVP